MKNNEINQYYQNLQDILLYLSKHDIEERLIEKVLYLIEWKYILVYNKRLFDVEWEHSAFGICAKDRISKLKNKKYSKNFNNVKKSIINFILEKTDRFTYTNIAVLTFSTYPMMSSSVYETLDLIEKSIDYKHMLSANDLELIESVGIKKTFLEKIKGVFSGNKKLW